MALSGLTSKLPAPLRPFGWLIAPLAVVLVVLFVAMMVLPGMVKTDAYGEALVLQVESLTGRDFSYDRAKVSLFPKAKISLFDVRLQNAPGTTRTYMMQVPKLDIPISIGAAFGGEAQLNEIILHEAAIELESLPDGTDNWHFSQNAQGFGSENMRITLTNAEMIYTDKRAGYVETVQGINGSISIAPNMLTVDARMRLRRMDATLNATCDQMAFQSFQAAQGNCDIGFAQGENKLTYKGEVFRTDKGVSLKGATTVAHKNIAEWLDIFYGEGQPLFTRYFTNALPLSLTSDIYIDATRWLLNAQEVVSGNGTAGAGFIDIVHGKDNRSFNSQLNFSSLDLDALIGNSLFEAPKDEKANLLAHKEGLPFELKGQVRLEAERWKMGGMQGEKMLLNGAFDRGSFGVNIAQLALAENGRIAAKGAIKIDDKGPSFQGKTDVSVSKFLNVAPLLGLDPTAVPAAYDLPFRARFDTVLSPEIVSASGLQALLGDAKIRGAVSVEPFANPPLIDSKFSMDKWDFTPLYSHWFGNASLLDSPDQLSINPFLFEGLNGLRWQWKSDVQVKKATYFERKNLGVSIKTTAQAQSVSAQRFELSSPDGTNLKASMLLKTRDRQVPQVELTIDANRLMLDSLFRDVIIASEQERGQNTKNDQWTDVAFNLNPLLHANMQIKLAADSVFHTWFGATGVSLDADLRDGKLTIREMKAKIWDGDWVMKSVLELGLIPQFSLGFTAAGIELAPFLKELIEREALAGKASISGQIQSTGLSFSDWIDSVRGAINVQAFDPVMRDVNVNAIVDATRNINRPAELRQRIEAQFGQGQTTFRNLEGVLYLNQGFAQFTNMVLRSRQASGSVEGNIRLADYEADMKLNLGLIALAGRNRNFPHMAIRIKGPLEKPSRAVETQELEGFISRN